MLRFASTSLIEKGKTLFIFGAKRSSSFSNKTMLKCVAACVPKLTTDKHKGESGRIGIIGGCDEYTGAPYFAAIAALRTGADLACVISTQSAALAIKAYSPDLVVFPYLGRDDAVNKILDILPRLHSIVVGPGLGRDPKLLEDIEKILFAIKDRNMPVVIDADGLFLITQKPDIITGYKKAILTPNKVEFERLFKSVMNKELTDGDAMLDVNSLSAAMKLTIFRKGTTDLISDGCGTEAEPKFYIGYNATSSRRCGGQGDLLSGSLAIFSYWTDCKYSQDEPRNTETKAQSPTLLACVGSSALTRECNRRAFMKRGRSMLASDMICEIGPVFKEFFDDIIDSAL